MNWNKIKEKHPKAFRLWLDSEDYKAEPVVVEYSRESKDIYLADADNQTTFLCELRDLYDFFDEQGIYINIFEAGILTGKIKDYENFRWIITTNFRTDKDAGKWEETTIYNHDYPLSKKITRTEAEEQAFTKAFSILEDKL